MKRNFVAVILIAFSLNAFAESETKDLEELQKKVREQAVNIVDSFNKHKINTQTDLYQDIWNAEYNIIDDIEIVKNSIFLLGKIENKNAEEKLRVGIIIRSAGNSCSTSSISLKYDQIELKSKDVKVEIAKQAEYAKQACDGIDKLESFYLTP